MKNNSRISIFSTSVLKEVNVLRNYSYDMKMQISRSAAEIVNRHMESLENAGYTQQLLARKSAVTAAGELKRFLKLTSQKEQLQKAMYDIEQDLKKLAAFRGKLRKFGLPENGISGYNKRF